MLQPANWTKFQILAGTVVIVVIKHGSIVVREKDRVTDIVGGVVADNGLQLKRVDVTETVLTPASAKSLVKMEKSIAVVETED